MRFWRRTSSLRESAVRRLICEAALRSSSRHLWAERSGRSGSVSQLSVPPPQTHARAFEACSCLSHPGENHLDRNKMKSLYLTSWQPFNRTVIYCWFLFSCFVVRCCPANIIMLNKMLLTRVVVKQQNGNWNICGLCLFVKLGLVGQMFIKLFYSEQFVSIKSWNTKLSLNRWPPLAGCPDSLFEG